ncbi:30S ribosomal protein S8 [Candidatus Pacearchaeota archaeon]|nr:30S ribosomal protein S8 [Candidatus Pacearchaeota archaeon]
MSQDIIADTLNEIMNAKKSRKETVVVDRHSKLLLKVLEIGKKEGYIESYKINKTKLEIKMANINECKAIKPRFYVTKDEIMKYVKRFLPARGVGIMIISTNKGVITHDKAINDSLGGALIAYFY